MFMFIVYVRVIIVHSLTYNVFALQRGLAEVDGLLRLQRVPGHPQSAVTSPPGHGARSAQRSARQQHFAAVFLARLRRRLAGA
jgi:hypothetical protein